MARKKTQTAAAKPLKEVNLAKMFPAKNEPTDTIPKWYDYDKKLPKGDFFEVSFQPAQRWKIGLQGFEIHGLKRSLQVTRRGSVVLPRAVCILMICTLLKPGDVDLEDVKCYIRPEKAEKKDDAGDDGQDDAGDDGQDDAGDDGQDENGEV